MAINKNGNSETGQNHSSLRGQSGKLKIDKFAKLPASLNGINKQLP